MTFFQSGLRQFYSRASRIKCVYLWALCHVLCVVTGELSSEFSMALLEWFGIAA